MKATNSKRRMTQLTITMLIASLVAAVSAKAADGDLDPSFGTGGVVTTDFNRSTDIAYAVAQQADGKLVVAGTTYTNNDFSGEDFALARYNPDGTLDASFGVRGKVRTDFPGLAAVISAIVIQPDGKILVAGGAFPLFVFLGDFELARYNPDGSLDATFGSGGIVTTSFPGQGSYAFSLALQPDGKIIAAGTDFVNFSSDDSSNTDFGLARYNPDGAPDTTFGNGSGQITTDFDTFNDDAFSVLIQPDGKIIAAGSAKNPANFYDFALTRYLADGTIDTTFGASGKVRTDFGAHNFDQIRSAALQPDGKIVTAGFAISHNGGVENFALARYGSNGALDSTFSGDGLTQIDFGSCCQSAYGVFLQGDGKIIAVGYPNSESSDSDFLLARLDTAGALDPTFGIGGKVRASIGDLNDGANGALLQPDGKIVAVGFHPTPSSRFSEFAVLRFLNGSGTLALTSAVSRKTHGTAGNFDVALPLTGEPGLESRNGGGRHTLVFTFSSDVVSGSAAVTAGAGAVSGNPLFAGNTMTVNLVGVADVQQITVTLTDVTSSPSQVLPETSVSMNLLAGDVMVSKAVDNADVSLTKSEVGMSVTSANFRADVNASGAIDSGDVRQVKANVGHSLP
ncbi:MAG TPA: delta-60 repeat domain-containing protein [Chthoniobacterales bacterium]|nr:delta-60 repeat domain-containing protein [Chthoniobacterales bacterium]